ncbi:MAG: hypothetical protein ACKOCM_02565 [Cyanobacteriota bacterium]
MMGLAAAADLCLKPWRHAVVSLTASVEDSGEIQVRVEARDPEGARHPEHDLELEIYRSGEELNVMISWCDRPEQPMLWHGRHPVWMDGSSGERCDRPMDGAPLEALSRRLRALLLS